MSASRVWLSVHVRVDDRRHHRLAGQVDARRRRPGAFTSAAAADLRDPAAVDDDRGVLDRRRPSPTMTRAPSNTVAAPCISAKTAVTAAITIAATFNMDATAACSGSLCADLARMEPSSCVGLRLTACRAPCAAVIERHTTATLRRLLPPTAVVDRR